MNNIRTAVSHHFAHIIVDLGYSESLCGLPSQVQVSVANRDCLNIRNCPNYLKMSISDLAATNHRDA
jgi:hypothetical protein